MTNGRSLQGPLGKYPPTTGAKIAKRMDLTWDREDPQAVAALPPAADVPHKMVAVN